MEVKWQFNADRKKLYNRESYIYVKCATTIQATNTAVTSLQTTRKITDVIPNTGSDRGAGYALLLREAQPAPFNQQGTDRPVAGASTKEWRSGKCLKIRTPAVISKSWRQSHLAFPSGQVTCSEWVAGPRVVLIWGEWTEVTGLELRAQGKHAPQSYTCSTWHAASATFPFFFFTSFLSPLSLSSFFIYPFTPPPPPPASVHRLTLDPQGRGIKNLYGQCLMLHFTVTV